MKKWFGLGMLLLLLGTGAMAQTGEVATLQRPGIALVESLTKTNVYEIKLKSVGSTDQAASLDQLMLSRMEILSSSTNWQTRVCRVEALKSLQGKLLEDVVKAAGLEVAKSSID